MLQAQAGSLLSAADQAPTLRSSCNLSAGRANCSVSTASLNLRNNPTSSPDTLRVDYFCLCGPGNYPAMDMTTGACTQCPAGPTSALHESCAAR